jgi:hypothetical protein
MSRARDILEGKDVSIRYIVDLHDGQMPMEWKVKTYGKPNEKNLEVFVLNFLRSFQKGGVNDHAKMPSISKASILDQDQGKKVVATYNLPKFYVL